MTYEIGAPVILVPFDRGRLSRKLLSQTVPGAAALAVSGLVGAFILYARPGAGPEVLGGVAPVPPPPVQHVAHAAFPPALPPVRRAVPHSVFPPALPILRGERETTVAANGNPYGALINPAYSLGYTPAPLAQSAPLSANFVPASPASTVVAEAEPGKMPTTASQVDQSAPLPTLRPEDLGATENHSVAVLPPARPREFGSAAAPRLPSHDAGREVAEQDTTSVPQTTAPSDHRNFFQKLFGMPRQQGQELAYAAPEDGLFGNNSRRAAVGAEPPYDRWTAVYDIAAHTVYLPDGTRLEAHSGLGSFLDDPRHANAKMRGPTPPDVYELKPREALFHGVKALRLIPIGSGKLYGRNGLLAHTYMLGPSGQSFGCVSFKNYRKFLEAYQSGEIKRLVVVAGL